MDNLAWALEEMGRYAEAGPLYIRALEVRERVLGKDKIWKSISAQTSYTPPNKQATPRDTGRLCER